jgi:uncharacterized protein (DUF736 family)
MTKQYDNELRGVLFKNDDKETESHPDYKGNATIKGVDYFMDAWINTADSGRKYMSVKFKAKDKQASKAPAQSQSRGKPAPDFDEDAPPF